MSALSVQKKELLVRVGYFSDQAQSLDVVIPDETGYFSIDSELVKRIRSLIHQTADLMLDIMECYDAEAASGEAGEISTEDDEAFLKEIGAQISSQLAVEEVSGLAFVSRGQLLDVQAGIDNAIASRELWKVASQVDTGLRRAGRALVAIESAIHECEGLPVEHRQWRNVDDSLEVRRLYGEFRRAILSSEHEDRPPAGAELIARLRLAADRIAGLRRQEIYPYLRIDDRRQIRHLQRRVLVWLEGSHTGIETGAQLWSDVVAFARLLSQVNHRQEIREHDRLAVNGIYRRFFEGGKIPETLTPERVSLLEPLLGREDELDQIILDPAAHTIDDLRAPLKRLRKELGRPFETPPLADFLHPIHG